MGWGLKKYILIFSAVHDISRTFNFFYPGLKFPRELLWGGGGGGGKQICLGSNHSQIYQHMRAKFGTDRHARMHARTHASTHTHIKGRCIFIWHWINQFMLPVVSKFELWALTQVVLPRRVVRQTRMLDRVATKQNARVRVRDGEAP